MLIGLNVKCSLFLSDFNDKFNFTDTFSKKKKIFQITNFMKIHPVGAELFHADGRTDGETERWTE